MASFTNQPQPIQYPTAPIAIPSHQTFPPQSAYFPAPISNPTLKYSKKSAAGLGLTQLTIGLLLVVFMIVELAVCTNYNCSKTVIFTGYGIWCGVIFFVTGLLGYLSSRSSHGKGMIISFMVMSIISACFTTISFTFGLIDAIDNPNDYRNRYDDNIYYYTTTKNRHRYVEVATAMSSLMATLSVIEALVAIISSALCCRAVCCCKKQKEIYIQLYNPATQQITIVPINTAYANQQPIPMVPPYNVGAAYLPNQVIPPYTLSNIESTNESYTEQQNNNLPTYDETVDMNNVNKFVEQPQI